MKCLICGKETSRMSSHLVKEHEDIFGGLSLEEQKHVYFFRYFSPESNPNCPYCGKPRKCCRFTRAYDTCASKSCKSEFSSKGALNQIELEGGVETWHKKRMDAKEDFSSGLRKVNQNQREFYATTGFKDRHEMKVAELLKGEDINFVYQPKTFFQGHGKKTFNNVYLNFIPDFLIDNLVIEVDGWSHDRKLQKDEIQDNFCVSKGYKVLRISVETVNNSPDLIIPTIKNLLSSTTIEIVKI